MIDGWIENRVGEMPRALTGKRIRVRLRCGRRPTEDWPAGPPTRWTLEDRPFDITHYQPVT